jgi:hypothetical protein
MNRMFKFEEDAWRKVARYIAETKFILEIKLLWQKTETLLARIKAVIPIIKWAPLNKKRLGWSLLKRRKAKKG